MGEFRHVKIFERVRVKNIWDGVDLIFYMGSEGAPKYDFIVHGNKLDRIKLKVSNAEELKVAEQLLFMKLGELEISDIIGHCYSETNPEFNLNFNWKLSDNILSFSSDRLLNNSEIYRIDPQILLKWATYYGDEGSDVGKSTDVHSDGGAYFCGSTSSKGLGTSGKNIFQDTLWKYDDAFITRFHKDGGANSRMWTTYYGDTVYKLWWNEDNEKF